MIFIVPTRGRPHKANELIAAWRATHAYSALMFVTDADDPALPDYEKVVEGALDGRITMYVAPEGVSNGGMVGGLNHAIDSMIRADFDGHRFVGFMGDDHRPRTDRWDVVFMREISRGRAGLAYGNDLLQGVNLPTAVLMSSAVITTLGYMAPPTLRHLYVDNYWRDLGTAADRLIYIPSVVIEHMHPVAGKADWDDEYRRVNNGTMYADDYAAYEEFKSSGRLAADVEKIRALH